MLLFLALSILQIIYIINMSEEAGNIPIELNLSQDPPDIFKDQKRPLIKNIAQENRLLRKQNQILKKQLEDISVRLDAQIRKRLEEKRKNITSYRSEDVSSMQLQNAYKKCSIYKKQASLYKKKLQIVGPEGERVGQFQHKINQYVKEMEQLRDEVKHLRKITKIQEKGLTQGGAQGYIKVVHQNERLQEEVRILKKQMDQTRRMSQKAGRVRTQSDAFPSQKQPQKHYPQDTRVISESKKKMRAHTGLKQPAEETQKQKFEKQYAKIRNLTNEKSKLREIIDNLKFQLADKEKQNAGLRDKIGSLRKNNQILQAQVAQRDEQIGTLGDDTRRESKEHYSKSRMSENTPNRRVWRTQPPETNPADLSVSHLNRQAYPRKEQYGVKFEGAYQWTHQHFTGKIKELQVLVHDQGHIRDIHARYEKGEPKRYDQPGRFEVLSCGQDEFIKRMQGGFWQGYLQYLIAYTSKRRVKKYGNWQQMSAHPEIDHFSFQIGEGECIGALFGQNDSQAIRKLGCWIVRC